MLLLTATTRAATWAVELAPDVDPYEFGAQHQLRLVDSFAPSFHIYEGDLERNRAARDAAVKWAEEQVPQRRYPKRPVVARLEDDPLYGDQWHLQGGEHGVGPIPAGATGRGIIISIVDDGLQHTHPELSANYDARYSGNYNGGPHGAGDPAPNTAGPDSDAHGTAAAGVAVGVAHNGHCGMGVAPEARVAGVRLIAGPATDLQEAQALTRHSEAVHIYSSSWGPEDSAHGIEGPGRLVREALAHNGKGRVYVWAAGNGRALGDSCAFDGYAGNPYVNAIGATDYAGNQAFYSEGCSNLLAVAPSSGASARGIITADLMGAAGYDATECTRSFGGTSSAAPLAAGLFALMLQARPSLGWRDVRHVVASASRYSAHASVANAAGYKHSNEIGFGLLKASALLALAANHTLVPQPQRQCVFATAAAGSIVPGIPFTITPAACNVSFIENAIVRLALHCPRASGGRGSVRITLRAPSGTQSVLAEPRPGDAANEDYPGEGWGFSSLAFWGESPRGDWLLRVQGCGGASEGARMGHIVFAVFGY